MQLKLGILAPFMVVASVSLAPGIRAQEEARPSYRKFVIENTFGVLKPRGEMRRWYWRDADGSRRGLFGQTFIGGTYFGYRPIRFLQIDLGVEGGGSVAGDRRMQVSWLDEQERSDLVFFVPIGVRGVAPLFNERLLISAGGGASLAANVQFNSTPDPELCDPCSSRNGVGRYGVAQVMAVLGERRRIGLGVTARWTRVKLSDGFLPNYGAIGPADQWVLVGFALVVRI